MNRKSGKQFRELSAAADNVVYHYCSLDSLYGIITSKCLWLTSLQSTNDKKELNVSRRILDKVLQETMELQEDVNKKQSLEKILNAPKNREYRNVCQTTKYFGLSCVEEKDSLTHWDRYGSHGTGVCIGINLAVLDNYFAQCLYGEKLRSWLTHEKIIYRREEQEALIRNLLQDKVRFLQEQALLENLPHSYSVIYYSILNYIAPLFKDEGFGDENEYRIIFQENQGEDEARYYMQILGSERDGSKLFGNVSNNMFHVLKDLNLLYKDKKYAKISNMIRSYYALNLEPVWSDALISEVVIGPKCLQNKQELKGFLKSNELSQTNITISKIPIR